MPKPSIAEIVARRGLALPERTRSHLRSIGIWCDPSLTLERRASTDDWLIRGKESGGAVAEIGRYVGYCREDGESLPWLYRVRNFVPNGVHAVVLTSGPVVRLEVYRYETSYDLLISRHWLHEGNGNERPKLWNEILFTARYGVIELELWGRDKRFRGGVAPRFFGRNGDEIATPAPYQQPIFRIVEAVTSIGCHRPHVLREPEYVAAPVAPVPA